MTLSSAGKMKREGVSVSLEVEYDDNYDAVINKASAQLQMGCRSDLRLFKLRGVLIQRTDDWSIAKYKHYASDAIEIGLGKAMDPTTV